MKTETIKAIIAMLPCASNDATRHHIAGVHIERAGDKTILKATNGHMCVTRTIEDSSVPDGKFMIYRDQLAALKLVLKECGKYIDSVESEGQANALVFGLTSKIKAERLSIDFPNLDAITPNFENAGQAITIGLNAEYIYTLAKALKSDLKCTHTVSLTFNPEVKYSPVIIASPMTEGVAVLMPVRL